MKRILLTGAAGAVGMTVGKALSEKGYIVRAFDRSPCQIQYAESFVADLCDPDVLCDALDGVDAVIHLAAHPNDDDFMTKILPCNIIGPYDLLEACRIKGVKKLVLASTMQVCNGISPKPGQPIKVSDGTAPSNLYALSKVFLEGLANIYARKHKMAITLVRIGWFARNASEMERISSSKYAQDIYLSKRDCANFFLKAVESQHPEPGSISILFATSRPQNGVMFADIDTAKDLIGYEPEHSWPEGIDE